MAKSIVHKQRIEYLINFTILILFMAIIFYGKTVDDSYLLESCIVGFIVVIISFALLVKRKKALIKARKKASEHGLAALLMYELKENTYEMHIDPAFPGGLKKLYRACRDDAHKLASQGQEIDIYLTTHPAILKQWKKIMSLHKHIETREIEKLDKLAGLSPFQWYFIQKQLFGQQKKKAPKRGEWKTLETIIRKEPDDGKKDNPE